MKLFNTIKASVKDAITKANVDRVIWVPLTKLSFDKEFKELFSQEEDKVQRIAENMKQNGFGRSQPIIVNEEYKILDGNSRFMASQQAGLQEVPVIMKKFESKDEALVYELHLQLDRRNLSDSEIYTAYQKLAALKNAAGEKAKTDVEIAEELKISPRQISKMKEVEKKASEKTLEEFKNGEISLNKAYNQMKEETNPASGTKIVESSLVEESTIEVDEKEIEAAASAVMTVDKVIVKSKNGEKRFVKNRNGALDSVSEKTKAAAATITNEAETAEQFANRCRQLEQEGFRTAILFVQKELASGKTMDDVLKNEKFKHLYFENAEFGSAEESVFEEILKETELFKTAKETA